MDKSKVTARDVIIMLSIKYKNNWMAIYMAIADKQMLEPKEFDQLYKKAQEEKQKIKYVLGDKDYPNKYKGKTLFPPFVIYK